MGSGLTSIYKRQKQRSRGRLRRRRNSRRNDHAPVDPLPYLAREALLSRGELAFFRVLRRAVAGRCAISIKTRLADVVKCPDDLWETPHGRRLSQKHLDFVLYDPLDSGIVLAVELDDRTHDLPARRRRDQFIDAALAAAGVTLVRIKAAPRYCVEEIAQKLTSAGREEPARSDSPDSSADLRRPS